jgi:hypothetical protein
LLAMMATGLSTTRRVWRFLVNRTVEFQARRARRYEVRASSRNAEARGLTLLKEWLSPEQRTQFDAQGYFDVIGCHSGTKYRIRYGNAANIYELDEAGLAGTGWCLVPSTFLVTGDVMLAQKIALETNERDSLAVANRFPRVPAGTQGS